jgi:hypothetical protein
VDLRLLNI